MVEVRHTQSGAPAARWHPRQYLTEDCSYLTDDDRRCGEPKRYQLALWIAARDFVFGWEGSKLTGSRPPYHPFTKRLGVRAAQILNCCWHGEPSYSSAERYWNQVVRYFEAQRKRKGRASRRLTAIRGFGEAPEGTVSYGMAGGVAVAAGLVGYMIGKR